MASSPRKGSRMAVADIETSLSHEVSVRFLRIPHVVQVLVRRESDVCYVWTVVDQFTPEVRADIHAAERRLIADYRPAKFSFRILPDAENPTIGTAESFKKTA